MKKVKLSLLSKNGKVLGIVSFFICLFFILAKAYVYAEKNCTEVYGKGETEIAIATGSPGELGLLKVLIEEFNKEKPVKVCWIKAGTGESLKLLKENLVDLVMVHAPDAEKKAVTEGWATKRTLIGSNEFYIVGPKNDPAKIAEAKNVVDVYNRIKETKSKFISRGDNSGTHKKEMEIWKKAGYLPDPSKDKWYIVTKDFMAASLKKANDEKAYFMTDSSTWIMMKKDLPNLKVLFKGDKFLVNVYHALCSKFCKPEAEKFIEFLTSERGQETIRSFGKAPYGEAFYNDLNYAKKYAE